MKREEIKAFTEAKIKNAMLQLIKDYSLSHISIDMMISEANISRSSFYNHFESIDHVIKEIITDIEKDFFSQERISSCSTPLLNIQAEVTQFLSVFRRYSSLFNSIMSHVFDKPELFEHFDEVVSNLFFKQYLNAETVRFNNVEVDKAQLAYLNDFRKAGSFYVIKQWIASGCVETDAEVAKALLIFNGIWEEEN